MWYMCKSTKCKYLQYVFVSVDKSIVNAPLYKHAKNVCMWLTTHEYKTCFRVCMGKY